MQAKTLNQIVAELEAWASSHLQVHSFGQGDIWEVSPSSSAFTFPLMWVTPSNAEPKQNELVEQFNVVVCDLVDNGEANELEVLSDTRQILKDLVAWYRQQHSAAYIVEFQGAITPFTERFAERVSGNALTIRLRQPDDYDECAIPLGTPIPAPPFCGPAIYELRDTLGNLLSTGSIASGDTEPIVAPDGTVLRDGQPFGSVPSGGSINVPSDCPPCADGDVSVNTVPFASVASGGALDVEVENSAATLIGALLSGKWRVPNHALSINTVDVDTFPATVDVDLTVTLDGGATTPTYDSGTKTLDVTSAGGGGSISVAVSDATPSFGDTITITATPTGFAPTSYLFFAYDGANITKIAEQAGAVVNWMVSVTGTFDIYAVATDGVLNGWGLTQMTVSLIFVSDLISAVPVAGFSTRRLSISYTGDAALVRRSSDNAQLAIGYVGENLDTASLTAFVGVGDGFAATFYNQFSFNHATQGTAGLQPILVMSGVVNVINGRAALNFTGGHVLVFPTPVLAAHVLTVVRASQFTNITHEFLGGSEKALGVGGIAVSGIFAFDGSNIIQTTVEDLLSHQVSFRMGGAIARIKVDGVTRASGTVNSFIVDRIGNRQGAPRGFIGNLPELIIYNTILSDGDETLIADNQKAYYGTP